MKTSIFLLLMTFSSRTFAATEANLLAISQGVSSPAITSIINYSHGYTYENPVGVIYQQNLRLSGHYDTRDDEGAGTSNDGYGAEVGVGNGKFGAALGYYTQDCDSCEGDTAAALGAVIADLGVGLRLQDERMTIGLLFNPSGTWRVGLIADLQDPEGDNNNVTAYGAGVSYVSSQFTFSVDASKRDHENPASNDDLIIVTPGLALRFNMVSLMLSYDTYVNDDNTTSDDDDLAWGIGIGTGKDWHIAIYGDYYADLAVAGSLFF